MSTLPSFTTLTPAKLPVTGFTRLSPRAARVVLFALLAVTSLSVGVSLSPVRQGFADKGNRGPGDIALYRAELERMHAGESYYAVAADELPARGYPTKSVFNWRTPLPLTLIAALPSVELGRVLLGLLAAGTLTLGLLFVVREGGMASGFVVALPLVGALLPCWLGTLYVMPMLWAGSLIMISVCALGLGRTKLGVAAGIAAVFVRDLAGPYCAFAWCYAVWRREWKEAAMWSVGLAAYAAFFAWHVMQVTALQTPDAIAHEQGWLRFGGLAFLVSITQMNGFLLTQPQWLSAIYLPLALLGFASWQSEIGRRATLATLTFVVLFAAVGQPINQYWGSLIAPLLCLGIARVPWAMRDLWQAAALRSVLLMGSLLARPPQQRPLP